MARGAKKIYATDINTINLESLYGKDSNLILPIKLDVTNIDDVSKCRENCSDVEILFNNAGVECATRFIGEKSLKAAQFEMGVNYFGVHKIYPTKTGVLPRGA